MFKMALCKLSERAQTTSHDARWQSINKVFLSQVVADLGNAGPSTRWVLWIIQKIPLRHPLQYGSWHFQVHNNFFQLFVVELWLARTFEGCQKLDPSLVHGLQKLKLTMGCSSPQWVLLYQSVLSLSSYGLHKLNVEPWNGWKWVKSMPLTLLHIAISALSCDSCLQSRVSLYIGTN